MREFRFRAWGHQENDEYRMFYGVALSSWSVPYFEDIPVCDHELMQFTGLKDKNGREIYEGDIILYPYSDNSYVKAVIEYRISEWQSPCYIGKSKDDEIQFDSRCEIIGNIYEHPELIKDLS